jgi:hypothetical protein
MKKSVFALSIFLLATVLCSAQQSRIVIRMLNGKNGHPIGDASVNVWLGNEVSALQKIPDANDEIGLDLAGVEPRIIRVMPNMRMDCRSSNGHSPDGEKIPYSLDEILSKGIVGANVCGKATASPTPGVLILFFRPMKFYERWML